MRDFQVTFQGVPSADTTGSMSSARRAPDVAFMPTGTDQSCESFGVALTGAAADRQWYSVVRSRRHTHGEDNGMLPLGCRVIA